MSDAVSGAGNHASGSQAEARRSTEAPSNYRNCPSFAHLLRAGAHCPRKPPAAGAGPDKQFLAGAGGPAQEAGSEPSSASRARRPLLPEREERSADERPQHEQGAPAHGVVEWLDPLSRSLSQPLRAPPAPVLAGPAPPPELEQLLRDLVRRAAWGGDRRRGTARIELAAGELAGATLLVEADANDLRIDLELPAGVAAEPWRERLATRLRQRGFAVRELNVY
jgi:hypothetical protein